MKACLISKPVTLYWIDENGQRHEGQKPGLYGDSSELSGNCSGLAGRCSGLYGDCSGLSGNCTGVIGYCSGVIGNINDAHLTIKERQSKVRINDLIVR